MRGVAREDDAAVAELVHALARKGVDADPFQVELRVRPEQRPDAGQHVLRLDGFNGVRIPAQLEVDAPDIVGLPVQQHRLVGVKGRVEPEPALGREIRRHLDVGNQEPVAEDAAVAFLADELAHGRARAVAGDQPIGMQRVRAFRRFHGQRHAIVALHDAGDLVLPAQLDVGLLAGRFVQIAFGVVLLQVDERRAPVAGLGQQVKTPHFLLAEKHLAHVPRHALVDHALAHAQAVPDFQRALGKADGARSSGQPVVVVQHHHVHALTRQVQRRGQADGAGAHHHDLMARQAGRRLVRVLFIGELHRLKVDVSHGCLLCGSFSSYADTLRRKGSRVSGSCLSRQGGGISLPAAPTFPGRACRSRCAGACSPWLRRRRGTRRTACSGRRSPSRCSAAS